MSGFGFVLAFYGKFVLRVAAYLPLLCHILGCLAHVVIVEGIPKAITDHAIDIFDITHFSATAQMGHMRGKGHVFLTTSRHDVCVTQLDMLRSKRHGTQAGSTDLIDAPGSSFDRKTRIDMGLARWVLALA